MSDMTPETAKKLREKFPQSAIGKLPKGGAQLDYVGHAATTDRLLAVDPCWTWEPLATDPAGLPAIDQAGNLWIRLTVCGVTRIGVGDGPNMKVRIGDALRNAAMRFGVALDLWSKEELEGGGSDDHAAQAKFPPHRSKGNPQVPDIVLAKARVWAASEKLEPGLDKDARQAYIRGEIEANGLDGNSVADMNRLAELIANPPSNPTDDPWGPKEPKE